MFYRVQDSLGAADAIFLTVLLTSIFEVWHQNIVLIFSLSPSRKQRGHAFSFFIYLFIYFWLNTAQNTFVWFFFSYKGSQRCVAPRFKPRCETLWGSCGSIACYVHEPPPPLWLFRWLTHFYFHFVFLFPFFRGCVRGWERGEGGGGTLWRHARLQKTKQNNITRGFICMFAMCLYAVLFKIN